MSGDLQARKRRDKKKRREDGPELIAQPSPLPSKQHTPPPIITDDSNIHVHKEVSTGGGLCAKFIFFILLSLLTALIGLTITEYRGLTDIETINSDSYFAQLFEGWIDKPSLSHDLEEDDEISLEHSEDHVEDSHEQNLSEQEEEEEEEEEEQDYDEETEESNLEEEEEESDASYTREETVEDETMEVDSVTQEETVEIDSVTQEETTETDESAIQDETDESAIQDETTETNESTIQDETVETNESTIQDETAETEETEESNLQDETLEKDESSEPDISSEDHPDLDDEIADEKNDVTAETSEDKVPESEEAVNSKEQKSSEDVAESREESKNEEIEDAQVLEKISTENVPSLDENENVIDDAALNLEQVENQENTNRVPEDSDSEDDVKSTQRSGAQSFFDFSFLTNSDDLKIQEELDNASQNLNNDAAYALTLFNKILEKNPFSPRALYGKAKALDTLAEQKKSNNLLQEAILGYQEVLKVPNVLDSLYMLAAERCIDRMRFRGLHHQAVSIHKSLIDKFPDDVSFRNNLAVTYLTFNRAKEALNLLNETLAKWPKNGYALVHYGFILKTSLNDLPQAVKYLEQGISTNEPGVIDGRFFFHLGDALTRLGRNEEALKVYEKGVTFKLFLSKFQRSLYNVESLTGKPWWKKEEIKHTKFLNDLENNWEVIRQEGLSVLSREGYFLPEVENLRDVGDWKQFELYARGIKNVKNCKQCPKTCKIIETLPDAMGCKRGQIKFSVMHPGTHVWPHCGPTNCRLRIHLGLKVLSGTYIRVGEEIRSWKEGKVLIFDDSFEHEVWHNGTTTRLVLIVDIWHPELTTAEKRRLSPI